MLLLLAQQRGIFGCNCVLSSTPGPCLIYYGAKGPTAASVMLHIEKVVSGTCHDTVVSSRFLLDVAERSVLVVPGSIGVHHNA